MEIFIANSAKKRVHLIVQAFSELDAVFFEIAQDNVKSQMHFSHRLSFEPIELRVGSDQVGVLELQTTADEIRSYLVLDWAHRPPGEALDLVVARSDGHVARAVAVDFRAAKVVLMPYLEVELGPA